MEISVVIPIYNKVQYLEKLWQCLLDQTFQDFQCILVDDGSTDGSAESCDAICARDSRFQVLHIKNGGVSNARNQGIHRAEGKYLTFADGDDEMEPGYLENLYNCIEAHHADMVIGSFTKFWDTGKEETVVHPAAPGAYAGPELLPAFCRVQMSLGIYGYCWGKMFRRELTKELEFSREIRLAEDLDFYLRLYPQVKTIYLDDKPWYRYRQEAQNSSAEPDDSRIDYVTQLWINIRFRDFLRGQQAYSGENQRMVEEKINNYLYFSIFHCAAPALNDRISQLQDICSRMDISPVGKGARQKLILFGLKHNQRWMIWGFLRSYRSLRALRNRLRG